MAKLRRSRTPLMIKPPPRPLWHLALSGFLVSFAIVVLLLRLWQEQPVQRRPVATRQEPVHLPAAPARTPEAFADSLLTDVSACLAELGIWSDLVTTEDRVGAPDLITVRVPEDVPLSVANYYLTRLVRTAGGRVYRAEETVVERRVEIHAGFDSLNTTRFILQRARNLRRATGRIAFVIDGFGPQRPDGSLRAAFCSLPAAVTFAVRPGADGIGGLLDSAARSGHEVLLNLPVARDDSNTAPDPKVIVVQDDATVIREHLEAALRRVPSAVGVHTSARTAAAADPRVMGIILAVLRDRGLSLLDSRASTQSFARAMARKMHVPWASRDLVVDTTNDRQAIEAQLFELAAVAGRTGSAIGIGHDRLNTFLALRAVIPRLETRGHQLVPISQLVH